MQYTEYAEHIGIYCLSLGLSLKIQRHSVGSTVAAVKQCNSILHVCDRKWCHRLL